MAGKEKLMQIDVIIPVYRPKKEFLKLIQMLLMQTVRPGKIILMNTEEVKGDTTQLAEWMKDFIETLNLPGKDTVEVIICAVSKEAFDHGGTRRLGAFKSSADYLLFMTQDALPADLTLIERLLSHMGQTVAAVYARQIARGDANLIEAYTRIFNYPSASRKKTKEDLKTLGIKTYFCSNVCALYERNAYLKAGGFEPQVLFGEDMLLAAKLIQEENTVVYAADAKVIHSHNDNCLKLFHRNFDIGVSQTDHPEVYAGLPAEREGLRLVRQTFQFLTNQREYWMAAYLLFQSMAKYFGYLLGKQYRLLPVPLLFLFTDNKAFWERRGYGQNKVQKWWKA